MLRKKINRIIRDIETEIIRDGISDNSLEFDKIKMLEKLQEVDVVNVKNVLKVDVERSNLKKIIKYKILKPGFNILYKLTPNLAIYIRNELYYLSHVIKLVLARTSYKNKYNNNNIRFLVDCTQTSKTDFCTGIQRVTKKIIQNLDSQYITGVVSEQKFITNLDFIKQLKRNTVSDEDCIVDFARVEKFILLDSSWEYIREFSSFIEQMRKNKKSEIFAFVYDLIPIYYPELVCSEYFIDVFKKWHNMVFLKCDHIICNSKYTADIVCDYIQNNRIKRKKKLLISYIPLGADLPTVKIIKDKFIRNKIKDFVSNKTFLMVGTIEPRKGHMIALEAFTKRLDSGDDIKLLIIGRNGWKNEEFIDLLSKNKYYGQNILWLDDANDIELAWCYQHVCCLIAASKDEGYGLPLIEAAHYGVPIICSDIPVFREVAQGYADYFKVWDSVALAECIKKWLENNVHPDSKNIRIYSWSEATKIFMEIINGEREPYKAIN